MTRPKENVTMSEATIEHYVALPYVVRIYPEPDGSGYTAEIPDLPGCLTCADTLPELAQQFGISADALVETVERFSTNAREGRDPDFHRGETTYETFWGSKFYPGHGPNPTLGPIENPPYYGVKLFAGSVGNLGGLVVNKNSQVVNTQGEVIPGL